MNIPRELIEKAMDRAQDRFENGGPHLGAVRRWIQGNFQNGETVKWGSQDVLAGTTMLTPRALETLAEDIMRAVVGDFQRNFESELKALLMRKGLEE